jgi:hypothetical protein
VPASSAILCSLGGKDFECIAQVTEIFGMGNRFYALFDADNSLGANRVDVLCQQGMCTMRLYGVHGKAFGLLHQSSVALDDLRQAFCNATGIEIP